MNHVYRYTSPQYDSLIQRRAATYNRPSIYYDPAWADWNQNTLTTNLIHGLNYRRGEIVSVGSVTNPIKAPDSDDRFIKIFKRVPPSPSELGNLELAFDNWPYFVVSKNGWMHYVKEEPDY